MTSRSILTASFCLLFLSACGTKTVTLVPFDGSSSVTVTVAVADTPKEREKGMMGRDVLEKDHGMLFVFPEPQILKFWMKNTTVPLEILFFDAEGQFVNAHQMLPCEKDPCPQYASQALAGYALEVAPDFRSTNKIGVGWRLDLKSAPKMKKAK